jgi:hypothetical protein
MPREDLMGWKRILFLLMFALFLTGWVSAQEPGSMRSVVLDQLRRYPKMEIQDIYKLIFQATMGNEHSMGDVQELRTYLDEELATAETAGDGPELEPLVPDSTVVRVNLRAYKRHSQDAGALVDAMVKTASRFRKRPDLLKKYWGEVEALAAEKQIAIAVNDLKTFFTRMELKNFPPVHHSKAYEDAYHPAYRVILRNAL